MRHMRFQGTQQRRRLPDDREEGFNILEMERDLGDLEEEGPQPLTRVSL